MEVDLRERLVAGDDQALAEIYDRFANLVYGLALRVTGDGKASEHVTKEVFVHLWEHPELFACESESLKAWLCTVAHRSSVDWIRHNERQPRGVNVDEHEALRDALATLPSEEAVAVRLAYLDGRTYRQVAESLNIPEGTAKSRIRLGMQHLAALLTPREAAGAPS